MKRFFSFLAAAAMLFTASCSNDDLGTDNGNEAQVTFNLGLEGQAGTRATIGDGKTVTDLHYAVFNEAGERISTIGKVCTENAFSETDRTESVSLKLAKDQTYSIVFWAQYKDAYSIDDDMVVTVNYANVKSNVEERDAFYAVEKIEKLAGSKQVNVTLRRPFAQLNVGVTEADYNAAVASGVTITRSYAKVTGVYNTLNLLTGEASGEVTAEFALNERPTQDLGVDLNGDGEVKSEDKETFAYLSMNYILVGEGLGAEAKDNVAVEFIFKDGDNNKQIEFNSGLDAVPVERNFRTNLVGQILTGNLDFEVKIDAGFVGHINPTSTPKNEAELRVSIASGVGEITLQDDITLTQPLVIPASTTRAAANTIVLNLNGKTISGDWAKADGAVINVAEGAAFNLSNGTVSSTGKNGGSAILNNGTTTLDDVTINGARFEAPGWPSYGINNFGTLTINSATITTYHGAVATGEDGVTVINDATIDVGNSTETNQTSWALYVYDNGQLTVNDGTFSNTKDEKGEVYGGGYICTSSTKETIINGGTFDKTEGDNNGSGFYYNNKNLVIKGGTFDVNPPATYLAKGYKAVEKDGRFFVVAEQVAVVGNVAELKDALANGGEVILAGDVTYSNKIENDAEINLNGNTFEATGTIELTNNSNLTMVGGNYEVNGTYGHVDVRPTTTEGSVVVYENVHFTGNYLTKTFGPSTNRLNSVVEVCAIAADAHTVIKFKNCTFDNAMVLFEGMSDKTGTFEAVFEGCTFNALTSSAPIEVMNYVRGNIKLLGCTFNLVCTSSSASAVSVSPSSSTSVVLTATNNTFNAVAATPYTYDASKGETEAHNVKVNGTPKDIKFISAYANTTVTETGTEKSGIAKL